MEIRKQIERFPLWPKRSIAAKVHDAYVDYYNKKTGPKPLAYGEIVKAFGSASKLADEEQHCADMELNSLGELHDSNTFGDTAKRMLDVVEREIIGQAASIPEALNEIVGELQPPEEDENEPVDRFALNDWNDAVKIGNRIHDWLELRQRALRFGLIVDGIYRVLRQIAEEDFPPSLRKWSELTSKEKEPPRSRRPAHRPLDDTVPQDKVEQQVSELLDSDKKKYFHKDGTPKSTAIRDKMMEDHPEWNSGEGDNPLEGISSRGMLNRVNKALKAIHGR